MTDFTNKQGTGEVVADVISGRQLRYEELLSRSGEIMPSLKTTAIVSLPSITIQIPNGYEKYDITVIGARVGDNVQIFPLYDIKYASVTVNISEADTLTVIVNNLTGDDLFLPAGDLKLLFWR